MTDHNTILIRGGTILDGSGQPAYRGDVRLAQDRIAAIAPTLSPLEQEEVLPAEGLYVCPGFIDAHCHSDTYAEHVPDARGKTMQGVTTDVCGLCGESAAPIGEGHIEQYRQNREYQLPGAAPLQARSFAQYRRELDPRGVSTNMALFVGNANLRIHAVGYEARPASAAELDRMTHMLAESMQEGAFGLSTGLTYVPSMNSSTEELICLSRAMAPYGGIYNSHMRNESDRVLESIQEVITIAQRSGCKGHISHLKASGKRNHGKAEACLELIHDANARGIPVDFDVYPYTAGSCGLRTLLPPELLNRGLDFSASTLLSPSALADLRRRLAEADWDNLLLSCGGEGILLADGIPGLEGQSIAQIAARWQTDAAETVARLLCQTEGQGTIIYHALAQSDLRAFLRDPLCSLGTDAFLRDYTGPTAQGCPHPRNYGAFPRWLRSYLLEGKLLPLEEGIRKITALPAGQFGLRERGLLRPGYRADLTIFDPRTVRERGTFLHPAQQPDGIVHVIVNGQSAVKDGRFCHAQAGRILHSGGQ